LQSFCFIFHRSLSKQTKTRSQPNLKQPNTNNPTTKRQSGYPCLSLHGGKDQSDRECTVADFKAGVGNVLVATSVAARGLDVRDLVLVRLRGRFFFVCARARVALCSDSVLCVVSKPSLKPNQTPCPNQRQQ
jgi:hypothetical protein